MAKEKEPRLIDKVQEEIYEESLQKNGDYLGVNHLAVLLLINQKVGELTEAIIANDQEQIKTLVRDICFKVLDCTARYGMKGSFIWPIKPRSTYSNPAYILIALGRVNRTFYETYQKASYTTQRQAWVEVRKALLDLLLHLAYYEDVRDFPFAYWKEQHGSQKNKKP